MLTTGVVLVDPVFTLALCVLITLVTFAVERSLYHGSHRVRRH